MKILITGKTSYIANTLKNHLDKEHEVTLVSLRNTGLDGLDLTAEVLIHCAAIVHKRNIDEETYSSVNTSLTIELAKKARECGVKQFIFFSTMAVYGLTTGEINAETKETPITPYGRSKLDAENGILPLASEDFKVAVIRPPMVYGPDCPGNFKSLYRLAKKMPVFPYVKNERSMIYAGNLAEFIRFVIVNDLSGIFCPQDEQYVCTSDMVRQIGCAAGKKIYLSKLLGTVILLFKNTELVRKIFLSLTYDAEMSGYFECEYCVSTFNEAIEKSCYK